MTTAQNTTNPAVSVTETRDDFARFVRDAEYGTRHDITRNGKLVARLVPITCSHCDAVIRLSTSGSSWVDGGGWDHCDGTSTSHEPTQED